MMPKIDLRQADLEREDDAKIMCRSCHFPAIGEGPYCGPCKDYWENDAPILSELETANG